MAPSHPSKSVCEFFYTEVQSRIWKCNKCLKTKTKNGGWTNLLSHLRACVGLEYEKIYDDHKKLETTASVARTGRFFLRVSEREREMYQWIKFIVMKNLPVSFVDCPYTREIAKLKPVSGRTLRCNILALREILRESIKRDLPSKFIVVFDGWSEGSHHYIGVAASYMTKIDSKEVAVQTMLSMQPLLTGGIQGMRAKDHLEHLLRILQSYGKTCADIICLVGDNCSVNQSMARTLQIPLIGCASHKFNLAVRRWIDSQPDLTPIIHKVGLVMKKASTLKVASQLRELTSYATVRNNDTRWSSTFQMVERFLKIQNELSSVVDLLSLLPNHLEVDLLARAFCSMKKFDSVTIMLQRDGMSFVESREIFDLFLIDFPDFAHYISNEASIIEDEMFEKAVMQLARGMPLTEEQRNSIQGLLVKPDNNQGTEDNESNAENSDEEDTSETFSQALQRKLKRQKRERGLEQLGDKYLNLDMLPGTSVNCERLFSMAKFILSDTRKRTNPNLFEALLLLKVNTRFWSVYSVGEAMGLTAATTTATTNADDDDIGSDSDD